MAIEQYWHVLPCRHMWALKYVQGVAVGEYVCMSCGAVRAIQESNR